MTVTKFAEAFGYEVLCMPEPDREISGGYSGDLLSWVMGRLREGDAWVTIMSNVNVVAVATLTEPCAVILAEDVELQPDAKKSAEENGITVLTSPLSAYEICTRVDRAEKGI